jgi:hypothetical protein
MVLKWIGVGRVDHPMAEAKAARQIVEELPADSIRALEEIVHWLDSINRTEGFSLGRRFENVDLLDGAAQNHARRLARDYLSAQRQQKFQENRLWNAAYGFYRELGTAYLVCLEQSEHATLGATAIRKNVAVIVARALRALTLQLKWTLLRYGPVEPRIWTEIARLYRAAEEKGFAEGPIEIYPGGHGAASVQEQFLRAMMLAASATDGLAPLHQEIAERLVSHFARAFRLARKAEGCSHCFDLGSPRAPSRLFQGVQQTPTMRFFGAGEAEPQLMRLIAQIQTSGALPSNINLRGTYDRETVVAVLRHLAQYWSEKPPARGSERRPTAGRITVVPGWDGILEALDPSDDTALDFAREQSAESWIIENVSDGGYGAIIPTVKSDWIRVGTLVGVKSETSRYWGVGIVRRIARDEHQQRRVGIQLLARAAIPIRIGRAPTISSVSATREPQPGILLSTAPDARGEVGVLMRAGTFNPRDSLNMTVRDKSYLLLPSRLVEGGEDYDWAKFRVMQRTE